MYLEGNGVSQNNQTAHDFFVRGAKLVREFSYVHFILTNLTASTCAQMQGDPDSMNSLGYMYSVGLVVPQDLTEAYNWYARSAKLGNADGQMRVGVSLFSKISFLLLAFTG